MFSDTLIAQFSAENPRFVAYATTPEGKKEVGASNYELQAWALAEAGARAQGATPAILDKLANFGHGAIRTRLVLSPAQLAQRLAAR